MYGEDTAYATAPKGQHKSRRGVVECKKGLEVHGTLDVDMSVRMDDAIERLDILGMGYGFAGTQAAI